MARPSKTQQFAVYEDACIPSTPPHSSSEPLSVSLPAAHPNDYKQIDQDAEVADLGDHVEGIPTTDLGATDTELDDARRESAISSLPESSTETDQEGSIPMHRPYTSPMTRPSFRRLTPFERSPRRPVLPRSRTSTSRSTRSNTKASPLQKRYKDDDDFVEQSREYPLILLHVTLLPSQLRWSFESAQEVLPPYVLDNLRLLHSRLSHTILQRGILIPHPREEYELLEERLLEALELKKERVSKCGHFRARDSTSSIQSAEGSVNSADSGVGSSIGSYDECERCATCHSPIKAAKSGAGDGMQRWSIKVFAANGLMGASAWAAAWSEMERVDVEILPWIHEDIRKQLDARMAEEDSQRGEGEDGAHVRGPAEREIPSAHENNTRHETQQGLLEDHYPSVPPRGLSLSSENGIPGRLETQGDLPQIYRTEDIPLSLLLRNYIVLLAQDKKNMAIFGLIILALWITLGAALKPAAETPGLQPLGTGLSDIVVEIPMLNNANSFENPASLGVVTKASSPAVTEIVHPAVAGDESVLLVRTASPDQNLATLDRTVPAELDIETQSSRPQAHVEASKLGSSATTNFCENVALPNILFASANPTSVEKEG